MIPFTESLRYEYPLTKDSLVIDCGGYEGNFAFQIAERYGCHVVSYEPIRRFHQKFVARLLAERADKVAPAFVVMVRVGVGATMRSEEFTIKGDMSGIVADGEEKETVQIMPIAAVIDGWLKEFDLTTVALLKLNIEGMEFETLEALLDAGYVSRIDHLQIQWHSVVPQFESRREAIRKRLAITHQPSWELGAFDNGWDGWRINT